MMLRSTTNASPFIGCTLCHRSANWNRTPQHAGTELFDVDCEHCGRYRISDADHNRLRSPAVDHAPLIEDVRKANALGRRLRIPNRETSSLTDCGSLPV